MSSKTSQLQVRVSPGQKASLKRLAEAAGLSVSAYVLSVVLPPTQLEFSERARALRGARNHANALSDLMLFLSGLSVEEFPEAVDGADLDDLPLLLQNYAAATVEQEAARKGLKTPRWAAAVPQVDRPHFSSDLRSLRPYLMRVTPPAFKRRNVFVALPGIGST